MALVTGTGGMGLPDLLARVREELPEGEFAYDPEDVGTQPLRFFVVEYLREAAFQLLGDELPYAFTAEVEEFREAERPVYIRVTLFVERESQKGIVVGKGGQRIKAIGEAGRAAIGQLLGCPVHLVLQVKVAPNWSRDGGGLRAMGYE